MIQDRNRCCADWHQLGLSFGETLDMEALREKERSARRKLASAIEDLNNARQQKRKHKETIEVIIFDFQLSQYRCFLNKLAAMQKIWMYSSTLLTPLDLESIIKSTIPSLCYQFVQSLALDLWSWEVCCRPSWRLSPIEQPFQLYKFQSNLWDFAWFQFEAQFLVTGVVYKPYKKASSIKYHQLRIAFAVKNINNSSSLELCGLKYRTWTVLMFH